MFIITGIAADMIIAIAMGVNNLLYNSNIWIVLLSLIPTLVAFAWISFFGLAYGLSEINRLIPNRTLNLIAKIPLWLSVVVYILYPIIVWLNFKPYTTAHITLCLLNTVFGIQMSKRIKDALRLYKIETN